LNNSIAEFPPCQGNSCAAPKIFAAAVFNHAREAIHSILDVMYAKAPYTVIQRAVHIHPTVSELIPAMLGEMQPL